MTAAASIMPEATASCGAALNERLALRAVPALSRGPE